MCVVLYVCGVCGTVGIVLYVYSTVCVVLLCVWYCRYSTVCL